MTASVAQPKRPIPAKPDRFRSSPVRGIDASQDGFVDRKAGVIRGYSVAKLGVTLDERCEFDDASLEKIVELGNTVPNGIKSRFTHPSMSDDGMGKFLGRSRNFRRDGDTVRADLHLSKTAFKTPEGDLATYVLDLAEDDPDAFGCSVVIGWEQEYRREEDGTLSQDAEGNDLPPLCRIFKLWASDVVDDPAVDQGFFGHAEHDPARYATTLLDQMFGDAGPEVIRARVDAFLNRYFDSKGFAMSKPTEATKPAEATKPQEQPQPDEREAAFAAKEKELADKEAAFAKKEARFAEEQEIHAACRSVGRGDDAEGFCQAGKSLKEVQGELLKGFSGQTKPAAPGGRESEAEKDPDQKLRDQYRQDAAIHQANGVSEEDYLFTAKIDQAGGYLPMPGVK